MKNPTQHHIAEVPRSSSRVGMTIGIDRGDVWSHYCTLNEDGDVVGPGRFRTTPRASRIGLPICFGWIATEAGTYSIWISEDAKARRKRLAWKDASFRAG